MKSIMYGIAAVAAALFITGCDKLPTPEKMTKIATAVGKAAGYACELAKLDANVKESIVNVLDVAAKVVPAEGQTFADAWAPIINEEVQKLVAAGKLNDASAAIVKLALGTACDGIDYVFVKYPKAKDVKELVGAAVDGFTTGFKNTISLAVGAEKSEFDEEAYKYLKAKMAK